ncbi:MAG: hypothetical protein QOG43_846 [Actinomycetota bacterium]|nr:hypothetical protein [Actinomycetota bacterium]
MTMDGPLLDLVVDRLAVASLTATVEDLVIAACEGPSALDGAIGGTPPKRPLPTYVTTTAPAEPLAPTSRLSPSRGSGVSAPP